ncbi:MAG: PaaI family thioesterase [Winogradskyella sp.]|uniref:PaaI family thioesterase n=1 Tax=Winogradskyella sp. TaxID=1883156 RepID=UPI003858885B
MYKIATEFLKRFFKASTIYKYGFNWSPMYKRTTAKLIEVSDDLHYVKIRIKLNWKNRNYAGSLFGGSMLAATDPIYMIQLIQILGEDYVVWDKAVEARYKKPAKSTIYGEFIFTSEDIKQIKQLVSTQKETDFIKTMSLVDQNQNIIATFNKTLYIADKSFYKQKLKRRKTNN